MLGTLESIGDRAEVLAVEILPEGRTNAALSSRFLLVMESSSFRLSAIDEAIIALQKAANEADAGREEGYEPHLIVLLVLRGLSLKIANLANAETVLDRAGSHCDAHGDVLHSWQFDK